MKLFKRGVLGIKNFWSWFLKRPLMVKLFLIALVFASGWFVYTIIPKQSSKQVTYQTAKAEKGTLIVSVEGSGQVSTANNASVSTQVSGVVKTIYAPNGQEVKAGDPIVEVELDLDGKQRNAQAWASYLSAKNNLENAKISYYAMQADLFTNWKKYKDLSENSTYTNSDGSPNTNNRTLSEYIVTNDGWLSAEAKYKNQENVVAQAQTSLTSAWLSYQQTSPIIYAPISGTVTGFSYQIGSVITSQSNSSGTSASQKVASIKTQAVPSVTVSMTQIDVSKLKIGNKATITFDAFPNKTYTGKVISIDTVGSVSSGVTSYPTVIVLDTESPELLTNMTAQANIITDVKDNAVLIPSTSLKTQDTTYEVQVKKNGKYETVTVEIGLANDTQTEITSGISEGDEVVTGSTTASTTTKTATTSPFSIMGGNRGGR
jgi:multidrug efflux pump subunit AcrA (membrane-fusion protein)